MNMFKGFGKPKQEKLPDIKQLVDVNLKGYWWLQAKLSNDKDASQKLAQFVVRCVGIIKDKGVTYTPKQDELQLQFARVIAYVYYTQMSVALAEFEPTGVDGMSITKTIDVLSEATDEQLKGLEEIFA
jgi:hypothetical protein